MFVIGIKARVLPRPLYIVRLASVINVLFAQWRWPKDNLIEVTSLCHEFNDVAIIRQCMMGT